MCLCDPDVKSQILRMLGAYWGLVLNACLFVDNKRRAMYVWVRGVVMKTWLRVAC